MMEGHGYMPEKCGYWPKKFSYLLKKLEERGYMLDVSVINSRNTFQCVKSCEDFSGQNIFN